MLDLVGNPNCWFCHAQALIISFIHDNSAEMQEWCKSYGALRSFASKIEFLPCLCRRANKTI